MDDSVAIRKYKDRLRIFLILYYFSEEFTDKAYPNYKKVFKGEVKIQKIDFLLRNPDYLAYELLLFSKEGKYDALEIKDIVREIITSKEPQLRRLEMEKFFFGAYEDIDDVISFLKSIGLIDFRSRKSLDMRTVDKYYYVTDLAIQHAEKKLDDNSPFKWYIDRCNLIKKYFGDLSGSELKALQYKIDEYKDTAYKEYIDSISDKVKEEFKNLFCEVLA